MDYTKLTLPELANGMVRTETAIRWCREILDDLQEPKTIGMQAAVVAIRDLLPRLEEDLKTLDKAYTNAKRASVRPADLISPQWFRRPRGGRAFRRRRCQPRRPPLAQDEGGQSLFFEL
jgi:hypothetical protein